MPAFIKEMGMLDGVEMCHQVEIFSVSSRLNEYLMHHIDSCNNFAAFKHEIEINSHASDVF
jgi:hypothetical protein